MATRSTTEPNARSQFARGLSVQMKVIGALIMRELHTRYGRDNIGYLWVIGEPLTLATAIGLIHAGTPSHYGSDMLMVPFAVMGYVIFIMFRGIFNRAEGTIESNAPLMYHKMVTILDMMLARMLLEAAGTFLCLVILLGLLVSFDLSLPPARPLYLMAGVVYMIWFAFGLGLMVVAGTHDNRLLARFVHPVSYILMPLSGAFYRMEWVPLQFREILGWIPFTHIFELSRYGMFQSATLEYVDFVYLTLVCLSVTYIGLVLIGITRKKVHLS